MIIFLLHTIGFKLVDILMINYFDFNGHLYGWGHINGGFIWNFIHFVVGLTLPIVLVIIVQKIMFKLFELKGNKN